MKFVKPNHKALLDMHIADWGNCKKCQFGCNGGRKVYFRGHVPADVLFIGEAPGLSEHSKGEPFCSPSGEKLDEVFEMSTRILNGDIFFPGFDPTLTAGTKLTHCICNTILCSPYDASHTLITPTLNELGPCSYRLVEFINIVSPRLIIRVGAIAASIVPNQYHTGMVDPNGNEIIIPTDHIVHPAWILRQRDKDYHTKECASKLFRILDSHFSPPF